MLSAAGRPGRAMRRLPGLRRALLGLVHPCAAPASRLASQSRRRSFLGYGVCVRAAGGGAGHGPGPGAA